MIDDILKGEDDKSTFKKENYCDFLCVRKNAFFTSGGLCETFIKIHFKLIKVKSSYLVRVIWKEL